MSRNSKKSEVMDPSTREVKNPVMAANTKRNCWAIKQLVSEFTDLFPETTYETSNYDGRNTALDVTFDLTGLVEEDRKNATDLLTLLGDSAYNEDARISTVIVDGHWPEGVDSAVLVGITPGPHTQDSREPFGLAEAYTVLVEDDENGAASW